MNIKALIGTGMLALAIQGTAGGAAGECVWTPGTGKGLKRTSLKVSGNDLLLDKTARGFLIMFY